jgi:hypothetical protein
MPVGKRADKMVFVGPVPRVCKSIPSQRGLLSARMRHWLKNNLAVMEQLLAELVEQFRGL